MVRNIEQAIQDLIDDVKDLNLKSGIEKSLTKKLDNSIKILGKGRTNAAVGMLEDFINEVNDIREVKLTNEQADYLTTEAQRIIDSLTT